MSTVLIKHATIFDATGAAPFGGDVLVDGNRIAAVSPVAGQIATGDSQVIDGTGLFRMPGLTEGHGHLSSHSITATADLMTPPPEEQTLATARNAKLLFDHGFTSVYSASEAKLRLAVAVRNEINAGRLAGPRIRAGSLEISVTGAMGDEGRLHDPGQGPLIIIDGPEEMRKAVRLCCREDATTHSPAEALVCATRNGGLAMRGDGLLGTIAEGQLADLLLVDDDPLRDLSILTDSARLTLIMKDGVIHKNDIQPARETRAAA